MSCPPRVNEQFDRGVIHSHFARSSSDPQAISQRMEQTAMKDATTLISQSQPSITRSDSYSEPYTRERVIWLRCGGCTAWYRTIRTIPFFVRSCQAWSWEGQNDGHPENSMYLFKQLRKVSPPVMTSCCGMCPDRFGHYVVVEAHRGALPGRPG